MYVCICMHDACVFYACLTYEHVCYILWSVCRHVLVYDSYVRKYVCTHASMTHMYVNTYACMCIWLVYMQVCMHVCVYDSYICKYVCMYVYMTRIYASMYACMCIWRTILLHIATGCRKRPSSKSVSQCDARGRCRAVHALLGTLRSCTYIRTYIRTCIDAHVADVVQSMHCLVRYDLVCLYVCVCIYVYLVCNIVYYIYLYV